MSSNEGEHWSDIVSRVGGPRLEARGVCTDLKSQAPVPGEGPWPHLSAATAARPPRCPRRQTGRTRHAAAPTSGYTATPTSSFLAASTPEVPASGGWGPSPLLTRPETCSAHPMFCRLSGSARRIDGVALGSGASQIGPRGIGQIGRPSHHPLTCDFFFCAQLVLLGQLH